MYKCTKIAAGEYNYRGFRIILHTTHGKFWTAREIGNPSNCISFADSLTIAKMLVDNKLSA